MLRFLFFSLIFVFNSCKEEQGFQSSANSSMPTNPQPVILFFGNSLTEGLGLASRNQSFPALIEEMLKAKGLEYKCVNAGLSGDTTSSGLSRLEWVISQKFDYFVLELGANDMMRGISPKTIEKNLIQIIQIVKTKNPYAKILLVPMKPFPNLGEEYGKEFENVYIQVSQKTKVPLSRFLLDGVAGERRLNQKDGIHPTAEGHKIMAKNIFPNILELINKKDYTK
ncbi:MAG: arylesterase [Leptospiraceae bacterium]|nr:arylesterase [Leptospiraceae bacterium]